MSNHMSCLCLDVSELVSAVFILSGLDLVFTYPSSHKYVSHQNQIQFILAARKTTKTALSCST